MSGLYARSVFFVTDAERSLAFYRDTLGMNLDWPNPPEGRVYVFQVSLLGFELILNQAEPGGEHRAGQGRLFIGLEDDQFDGLKQHLEEHRIETTVREWGKPTLVIRDLDGNELFFWLPDSERPALEARLAST